MSAIEWLLEGDPAIRWQVMADLTDASCRQVAAERALVATEGWGARLLGLQADDGQWGGGAYSPKWTSTTYTLLLLRHMGVDPRAEETLRAIELVRSRVTLGRRPTPFFSYRGETCITGMVLALSAYFGAEGHDVVDWLLSEQLSDGGWNCQTTRGSSRSSFNTTISVLEGLFEYEGRHPEPAVADARRRGEEYMLERRMLRSKRTGEIIDRRWTLLSFPPRWHYDVLRGLDYVRLTRPGDDPRLEEALTVVAGKADSLGRWPLQNHHRGREHFPMEGGAGKPSRWNTLRARRVLRWSGWRERQAV